MLIRALEPLDGIELMRARRGLERRRGPLLRPGQAHPGARASSSTTTAPTSRAGPIAIEPPPPGWERVEHVAGPRIGITKAAELPVALLRGRLAQRVAAVAARRCAR